MVPLEWEDTTIEHIKHSSKLSPNALPFEPVESNTGLPQSDNTLMAKRNNTNQYRSDVLVPLPSRQVLPASHPRLSQVVGHQATTPTLPHKQFEPKIINKLDIEKDSPAQTAWRTRQPETSQ